LSAYIPSGYNFVGWNKSCDNITENTDIKAVIDYENYNLPVTVSVSDAVRYNYGYVVNCTVNNQTAKDSYGRVIVALKSDQGKLIKTTESSAYYISPRSSKNVEVLIPVYDDELDKTVTASVAEVYAVENFKTTVPVSEVVRANVTDSDPYTQWYDADDPEQNQYSGYERDSQTLYRCRDLDRTTAYSEAQRDSLINSGWVYTGEFTKSDAPVSTVNGAWSATSPERPDDTDSTSYSIETKTVTDTPKTTYYNYKRYKYVNGGTTYYSYGSTWATNHGLSGTWEYKRVTTERAQTDTIDGYKYYGGWFRADCNTKQGTKYTVYKETVPAKTHTEYRLVTKTYAVSYGLEKWLDWSDYSADVITATATREVSTKPQYRYNLGVVPRVEDNSGVERDDFCIGNAGAEFAGKQATLFIYKINEASDWTTEYLAQTVIGPDGTYEFDTYKLRQEPSDKTGDFTATLGIEGSDSAVYLGKIEAPKPLYKVEYVDSVTGNVIGSPQMVEEGESANAPEAPEHEGYTFLYWDMRSTNICQDFSVEKNNAINAVYGENQYSVTWIDWERQQYKVQTYGHGEQLTIPDEMKGGDTETAVFLGWDKLIDGVTAVTSDMVVCSVYEPREYTVTYTDPEGNVVKEEQAQYGDPVVLEHLDETDQVVYTDEWDVVTEDEDLTVEDYFTVTSDTTVTPRYYFQNTAETPVADIKTGSYGSAQTVTLTSETDTAAIYYTLDGSDPTLQSSEAILYTQPITISNSCELRAYATAMNMNPSDEIHEYYAIGANQCLLYLENDGINNNSIFIVDKNELVDQSVIPSFEGHAFRKAFKIVPSNETIIDKEGNTVTLYIDGDEFDFSNDVITGDTTLHCYYDTDVYKVYFIGKNGAVLSEQNVAYGEAAIPPEAPEIDGFVFTGWDTDSYQNVTENNLMVKAKYVDEEHYVRVELEDNYVSMQAGRNTNIVYTVTGNVAEPEINCTSSDDSVATAELKTVARDGETVNVISIDAISKGKAMITLTAVDSGETAVCEIDVSNNPKQTITLKSTSYLQADESGYIRGFTLTTDDGAHYTETVEEIRSQFATPGAKLSFFDASGNPLTETDHIGTGTVISYTTSNGETSSFTAVVSGDMDGDGFVSNRDRTALLRCVVGKATPTPIQLSAMDVNADGSINNKDVTLIGLYLVNKAAF
ncbi:MAG: chitobiase/beta-hexosaminidase C-terminal domain-containing protein, partial [Clostridia bacterium]|nr:chitobiase/beta-hexosaminidase C-terminal domain-containing protein [Clostridia bacterium]